jgi:hypothetical protein
MRDLQFSRGVSADPSLLVCYAMLTVHPAFSLWKYFYSDHWESRYVIFLFFNVAFFESIIQILMLVSITTVKVIVCEGLLNLLLCSWAVLGNYL